MIQKRKTPKSGWMEEQTTKEAENRTGKTKCQLAMLFFSIKECSHANHAKGLML